MKIAKLFIISLIAICIAQAQESAKPEQKRAADTNNWPAKIFQVQYADVNQLAILFRTFGAITEPMGSIKAMAVRAPSEVLAAIEDSLKRLDVAPAAAKNIDLTVYLLVASAQESGAGKIPAELDPVVKQLKTVFSYTAFRLLDTLVMRSREEAMGEVSGSVALSSADGQQRAVDAPGPTPQQPAPCLFL